MLFDDDARGVRARIAQQRTRRAAGETLEIAHQVGLIVVAARMGDLGPARRGRARKLERAIEPHDVAVGFWRDAYLLAEASDQVLAAETRLAAQVGQGNLAVAGGYLAGRFDDGGVDACSAFEQAQQPLFE